MKKVMLSIIILFNLGCAMDNGTNPSSAKNEKQAANTNPYNSQQVIKNEVNIVPPTTNNNVNKTDIQQTKNNNVQLNSINVESPIDNTPILKKSSIINLQVEGLGVAPVNAQTLPQAKIMARRAAIADAYRALAEKMYGIRVKGKETVKDLMLKNSEIRTNVYGLIRGACIDEESFKNGIYKVVMSLKLDVRKWNKYINNN